jgi:hypothetical protein
MKIVDISRMGNGSSGFYLYLYIVLRVVKTSPGERVIPVNNGIDVIGWKWVWGSII